MTISYFPIGTKILSRRNVLVGAAAMAPLLMADACVPNLPLPKPVTDDLNAVCGWLPTIGIGLDVALVFAPAVIGAVAQASLKYLQDLCANPPTDLGGVAAKVVAAVQAIEDVLNIGKAALSRPGIRQNAARDLAKINDALDALHRGKRVMLRHAR